MVGLAICRYVLISIHETTAGNQVGTHFTHDFVLAFPMPVLNLLESSTWITPCSLNAVTFYAFYYMKDAVKMIDASSSMWHIVP